MEKNDQKAFNLVKSLYKDRNGKPFEMTPGQVELFRLIYEKKYPRNQIECYTGFGKSEIISMAALSRASTFPEQWTIVGGTKDKAKIIMGYVIKHIFENEYTKSKFKISKDESVERIRRERSKDRLTFRIMNEQDQVGEIRILSGEAKRTTEDAGDILIGEHSKNIIQDDSPLIPDKVHGKMMRMLDDVGDSFLVKIGNTLRRNHFWRSHIDPNYHKFIVDYRQGIKEGRTTEEYIEEMRKTMDPLQFSMFYECQFPPEETIMDGGWMKFLLDRDIDRAIIKLAPYMVGEIRLGIDVAGAGRNYSEIIMRCDTFAQIIFKSQDIDPINLGVKAMELRDKIRKTTRAKVNCYVDAMGVGMKTYGRMKDTIPNFVYGILGGDKATNSRQFYNKRAEMYWNMREGILGGLKLVEHNDWNQLRHILYKIELDRRIKIIPKPEMLKRGIQSPDAIDALALTYALPPTPMVEELYPQNIKTDADFEVY